MTPESSYDFNLYGTLSDIQAARIRLGRAIYRTPCPLSHTLSRLCGCNTFFKLENLQMTGSFKERGR